jgi:GNAT superfamily N-acetyltransferase
MSVQPLRLPDISPVTVRPAALEDLPRLLALCAEHAESLAYERLPYGGTQADTLELVEALFDAPRRAWVWVAEFAEELVGYVCATVDFSILERGYYANLEAPFVRPAWRHIGVETHLFQQALVMAANTGCRYLQSQTPTWKVHAARLQAASSASRVEMVRHIVPAPASQPLGPVPAVASEAQPSVDDRCAS